MSATEDTPYGYCKCGCGERTRPAERTSTRAGWVKGEPMGYCPGHTSRRRLDIGPEDRGYETPCHIWRKFKAKTGHALIKVNGKSTGAHVVYYERAYGPVPDGWHVHHKCEQGDCVNPDHLEALSPAEHKRRHSSLTWDDVRAIRARCAAGEFQHVVGESYGISRQQVCGIVNGRHWVES